MRYVTLHNGKNTNLKQALLTALLFLISISPLSAEKYDAYESKYDTDKSRDEITRLLNKIDADGYYMDKQTLGFQYLFESRFFGSPFDYTMYIGNISSQNPQTIIRVEGGRGRVNFWGDILEQENIIRRDPFFDESIKRRSIDTKSHFAAQTLNFTAPWLGVLYNSYRSPLLTKGETATRFGIYLFTDIFLIWAAGRNWFTDSWNTGKYGGQVAAVLLVPRVFGAFQSANLTRSQNRAAELKYTFYY